MKLTDKPPAEFMTYEVLKKYSNEYFTLADITNTLLRAAYSESTIKSVLRRLRIAGKIYERSFGRTHNYFSVSKKLLQKLEKTWRKQIDEVKTLY